MNIPIGVDLVPTNSKIDLFPQPAGWRHFTQKKIERDVRYYYEKNTDGFLP